MPTERFIRPGLPLPEERVQVSFARSGGPGGQNVNKVETKVVARLRLAHIPGLSAADLAWLRSRLSSRLTGDDEIIVTASTTRHRERNLAEALDRLCAILAEALRRPKRRRPTRPTRGSKERRLESKRQRSQTKRMRRPPSD